MPLFIFLDREESSNVRTERPIISAQDVESMTGFFHFHFNWSESSSGKEFPDPPCRNDPTMLLYCCDLSIKHEKNLCRSLVQEIHAVLSIEEGTQ